MAELNATIWTSHSDFHEHLRSHMQVKRAIGKATLHKLPNI